MLTIGVLRRRQVISRLGGLSMADSTVSRSAKSERVVRVYVCSTYADMQAERTVLEHSVFPELRRRLSGHGIDLMVVDPWSEWGAEFESGEGLVRRFEAIDACRPFFIAILGLRYGDAPDPAPQELSRQHPWLADHPGASVLELEIRHGVLNDVDCARRSFFYFRDPGPILRIPAEDGALYTPESWDADQHLIELKKRIRESGRPVMEDYPCRWDEDSGQIVDLREFAQRVQADLSSAIETEFPEVGEAKPQGATETADETEELAGVPERPPYLDENVQFSVFRPKVVQPEDWYDLLAAAHLEEKRPGAPEEEPEPIEKVRGKVAQILGARVREYKETTQDSTQAVPRGGEITFVPEMENVEFNPPRQTILWKEDEYVVPFRFCASAELDGTTARGRMSVFLGAILLADVPLKFGVSSGAAGPAESPPEQWETARPYRKIFASYSHQDLVIVEQFERYAEALGDEYLRDWRTLRAGEVWNDRLMQMIDEADVFQLFWSRNSMNSAYVRREWEYALASGRRSFIRPVYWEEPLPQRPPELPPEELARLHFQRLGVGIVGPASVVPEEERGPADAPASSSDRVIRRTSSASFGPRGRPGAPTLPPKHRDAPAQATDKQGIEPAESTSPSGMEPEARPPLWEPTRRTSASVIRPEGPTTDTAGIEPEEEPLAEDAEMIDGSGREPAADDFLLTPLDEGADDEDLESGSQVIALDNGGDYEGAQTAGLGADEGMAAMLDEDVGEVEEEFDMFGAPAGAPLVPRAAGMPGEYYPEIKRKRLLLGALVLLAPVAIVLLILGLLWWQSAKVVPHVGNVGQMIEEERLDEARQYLDDLAGRSPGLSSRREIRELRSRLDRLISNEESRLAAFAKCLERARDASTSQAVSDALAAARRLAKTDAERADVDRLEQQLKE